jgi:hypothetical protein
MLALAMRSVMHALRSRLAALAILAAVVAALVVWRRGHDGPSPLDSPLAAPSLIDGRVWVEKRPEKHTDYVHSAFFLSRANLALFDRASSYEVRFEIAELTRDGEKVRIFFPQTSRDTRATFRVTSCNSLPPFDLCLDLSDNPWGGPKRYYGFTNPEDERASLGALAAEIRAGAARARGE